MIEIARTIRDRAVGFTVAVFWVNLVKSFSGVFMLISALLIMLIAAGGLALTYLIVDDEPFMWRLAAGTVIGSALCGTAVFVIAMLFGLNTVTAAAAIVISMAPLAIFRRRNERKRLTLDWNRAKGKLQGGSFRKSISVAFYVFFLVLFCVFFGKEMYETQDGIFTGGSQNLGDLPFHLGAIFSFTDGANFPPQNPSFAGARFSYPFVADLLTAQFIKLGADVAGAMFVQNVAWAVSLLVLLERFVFRLTGDRLAGKIAPWLLFFSGGLGFLWFFSDYWHQAKGFFEFLWNLPKDYTIGPDLRWGNSLVTLFLTQRSLLLGMPLTIFVLGVLWRIFARENVATKSETVEKGKREKVTPTDDKHIFTFSHFHIAAFVTGLIAGTLPLVHLHSLAVLFVVTVFLFGFRPERWREWIAFGLGVALVAVPELAWSMLGTATRPSEFFAWHFGWDHGETNILWFWVKNTGLLIPILIAGIYLFQKSKQSEKDGENGRRLLLFYTPFLFCFLVSNATKLAPWEWDNIKILIYWFVGSIPLVAYALSIAWKKGGYVRAAAALGILVLTLAGALDVWRTVSGQIKTRVFDHDAIAIAELIKQKTRPDSLFLNAPTYNTAVALTGRRSLIRYPGHLMSHGIDYREREEAVKTIYRGAPEADDLLARFGIDYVLVSGEEAGSLNVNRAYFNKFPVAAESGAAKVYKVR